MSTHRIPLVIALLAGTIGGTAADCAVAADVRTYEQDGSLIEETRQIERKPVAEIKMEEQQVVRYTERVINEVQTRQQVTYVPITEYKAVPRVEGRWNPFVQSRWVYDYVPQTRYEARTTTVQVPITRKQLVPETVAIQVPVRKLGFVNEEKISRVVLGPAGLSPNPSMVAQNPTIQPGRFPNTLPSGPFPSGPMPSGPMPSGPLANNSFPPNNGSPTFPPNALSGSRVVVLPNGTISNNANSVAGPMAGPGNAVYGPQPETSVANRPPQFGGISRFESDPPRQPFSPSVLEPVMRR